MLRVCSGFSPQGRIQYGEQFLRTFDKYWPTDVQLQVYVEEAMPMPRKACRDLWAIPGAREFHVEHRDNADAQGRVPHSNWKRRDAERGYCFKHDAYKFWKQILIPAAAAADMRDGEILVWLDADVLTHRAIPPGFVEGLLGKHDVAYLGREPYHSEIGFWAVRLGPHVRHFLEEIALFYTTGEVFQLDEWHSAFVWDTARKVAGLSERNLCRVGDRGHVWPRTELGKYTIHNKGLRKGKPR